MILAATWFVMPDFARAASPQQVNAAVSKAVAWLYAQQKPAGHWEDNPRRDPEATHGAAATMDGPTHGGWTAIATFALLEAGEKPTDPRLAKAIAFLRTADLRSVYSIGLRCMVFAKLPPTPENLGVLRADADRILASAIPEGRGKGLWDYGVAPIGGKRSETGTFDHSVSQFGVLGLWACSKAGIEIPPARWRELEQIWRSNQNVGGGWSYNGIALPDNGSSTPGITAAGIATLLIIQDSVGAAPLTSGVATGAGVAATTDLAIVRGLGWLDKNFDRLPREGAYALYAAERIGTAGGYRFLGRHDWYQIGSDRLLAKQLKNGSWDTSNAEVASTDVSETALAVLFLVHGRAPVLISKLNYSAAPNGVSQDAGWNQRPRDVANLVRYTANSAEQPYNWQIVGFNSSVDEMLDVPVTYVSGSKPIVLLEREREKLKLYLEGGGMLMASSEAMPIAGAAGSDAFSRSIVELGRRMFGYTFRELPLDHPIFTDQQFRPKQWLEKPVVWGMSNGVRELIVLLPLGDHGRSWNFNSLKNDSVKFEVGADILQYAVSRERPPPKGQTHVIKPRYLLEIATSQPSTNPATLPGVIPPEISGTAAPTSPEGQEYLRVPSDARRMTVGRLKIGDNWDPEPGAWRRLSTLLANDFRLFVEVKAVEPSPAQLAGVKLLHWTGTSRVTLTDAQRKAIDGFIKGGGTLVVDAAGGSTDFADSASAELKAIFGTTGALLAGDDPVYRLREARIDKFEYRRFLSSRVTGKLNSPRMMGIDRAGRTIVFFSREDITGGCVGQNTDGIAGYSPATATAIMRNVSLLAAKR